MHKTYEITLPLTDQIFRLCNDVAVGDAVNIMFKAKIHPRKQWCSEKCLKGGTKKSKYTSVT